MFAVIIFYLLSYQTFTLTMRFMMMIPTVIMTMASTIIKWPTGSVRRGFKKFGLFIQINPAIRNGRTSKTNADMRLSAVSTRTLPSKTKRSRISLASVSTSSARLPPVSRCSVTPVTKYWSSSKSNLSARFLRATGTLTPKLISFRVSSNSGPSGSSNSSTASSIAPVKVIPKEL